MDIITASEARNNIGKLWERTSHGPVLVISAGKPVAVVVAPDDYEALRRTASQTGRPMAQPGFAKDVLPNWDATALVNISIEDMFADYSA